jgi:hypothetical protein
MNGSLNLRDRLPSGPKMVRNCQDCSARRSVKRRQGTSIAGLIAPANTNNSGRDRASLTASYHPMETPTMARFVRPSAAGNRASTSEARSFTR